MIRCPAPALGSESSLSGITGGAITPGPGGGELRLVSRGPARVGPLIEFLAARAIPGLEWGGDGVFGRNLPDGGWLELSAPTDPDADWLSLRLHRPSLTAAGSSTTAAGSGPADSEAVTDNVAGADTEVVIHNEVVATVRRVADLDTDLEPIVSHLAATDPELARRLAAVGVSRLPGTFDPFELAMRAVAGQQITVAAARTLLGRLVALAVGIGPDSDAGAGPDLSAAPPGDRDPIRPGDLGAAAGDRGASGPAGAAGPERLSPARLGAFPSAEAVAEAPLDALGMPATRRTTIRELARAVAEGRVQLGPDVDPDELTRQLVALPGIGPWTAGYVTMRVVAHGDGWPAGDLVLRQSLGVTAAEMERRAERWRPWRSYAALLLWRTAPGPAPRPPRAAPKSPTARPSAATPPSTATPKPRTAPSSGDPMPTTTSPRSGPASSVSDTVSRRLAVAPVERCTLDTPVGPLTLIGAGEMLVAGGFCPPDGLEVRLTPAQRAGLRIRPDLGPISRAVAAYLDGQLDALDAIPVHQPGTPLQQEVWAALRAIPAGQVRTYTELAASTSRPDAVRAAGTACGRNLVSPVVPCHRAQRRDGSLAGYYWGLDVKRWLLAHEARAV